MAISNFIPEIWSAQILTALRDRLVYAQAGMVNRDYEGEIARAGDTVHITSIVDVQVKEYTRNAGLTDNGSPISAIDYDTLSDSPLTVQITEEDYFAFGVDDIDRRQALPGFVEEAARSAAYGLAKKTDEFVAGLMANGVDAGNELGSVTVSDPEDAYDLLVDLRTKLVRSNTPDAGRWVVVPPELYAVLLKDDRFVRVDASGSTAGLRNGVVGRAAGFDVIEANVVPESDGVFTVLAGHAMATTFADQIVQTEALRLQTGFADAVRGLHVYGGLVVRPTLLASAEVEVSTSGS
jgi:hypothetical protein